MSELRNMWTQQKLPFLLKMKNEAAFWRPYPAGFLWALKQRQETTSPLKGSVLKYISLVEDESFFWIKKEYKAIALHVYFSTCTGFHCLFVQESKLRITHKPISSRMYK